MMYLRSLLRKGTITALEEQKAFTLQKTFKDKQGKTHRAIKYVVDAFFVNQKGKQCAIDVKGFATDVYKLKKKLFIYSHPDIVFFEVKTLSDYGRIIDG